MRVLVALLVLVGATLSAQAKDLLAVVLREDKRHEVQLHHQPSSQCMSFLREFKQRHSRGETVKLAFEAPPVVNGVVLEVNCIHEDGSVESSDPKKETVYCALTGKTVPAERAKKECS